MLSHQTVPTFIKIDDSIYNLDQITYFYLIDKSSRQAMGIQFAGNPEGDVVIESPDIKAIWAALNAALTPLTIPTGLKQS